MTTSATGGTTTKRNTDGEEARGGERDARAGKVSVDMELGRGNLRGGERGDHNHQWTIVHNPNIDQSVMSGWPLFGDWNQNHPIMSMLSGHGSRN